MNENINLCEILKGHEGKTFWNPLVGNITYKSSEGGLVFFQYGNTVIDIPYHGKDMNDNMSIFPSKDQKDWDKWDIENNHNEYKKKNVYVDKEKRDRMVQDIMSEFNFHKVHKVMRFLDWKYWFSDKVPSIKEIREAALECLNKVKYATEYSYCSTGGFCASFNESNNDTISLTFCIEEIDVEGLSYE